MGNTELPSKSVKVFAAQTVYQEGVAVSGSLLIQLQFSKQRLKFRGSFVQFSLQTLQHGFFITLLKEKILVIEERIPSFEHYFLFTPASQYSHVALIFF
jgi:hypothetical protein